MIADLKFTKGVKSINLKVDVASLGTFVSDYNQVRIILGNLIGNAVKYHNVDQDDPFIAVRFQITYVEAIIEIEDNGTGIAKERPRKDIQYVLQGFNPVRGNRLRFVHRKRSGE